MTNLLKSRKEFNEEYFRSLPQPDSLVLCIHLLRVQVGVNHPKLLIILITIELAKPKQGLLYTGWFSQPFTEMSFENSRCGGVLASRPSHWSIVFSSRSNSAG